MEAIVKAFFLGCPNWVIRALALVVFLTKQPFPFLEVMRLVLKMYPGLSSLPLTGLLILRNQLLSNLQE